MNISPSELAIMNILWDCDEHLTSTMIFDRINQLYPNKWQYPTVVTFLSRLVKKKAIAYDIESRSYLYYPIIDKQPYYHNHINLKLKKANVDPASAFLGLVGMDYTKENVEAARKLLEENKNK